MSFLDKFAHRLHKIDHAGFAQGKRCKYIRKSGAEGLNWTADTTIFSHVESVVTRSQVLFSIKKLS